MQQLRALKDIGGWVAFLCGQDIRPAIVFGERARAGDHENVAGADMVAFMKLL